MTKILNGVNLIQKCLVVGEGGKILALKRSQSDKARNQKWDLPGGGYEKGEEVIAAIKREVMEETGLAISVPRPVYFASGLDFASELMDGEIVFVVCYVCEKWTGTIKISDEHTEFRWVTPAESMNLDFGSDDGFFSDSIKAYLKLLMTYAKMST